MSVQIIIMILAVDFDGTIVEHRYPEIGNEIKGAFECLLNLKDRGHKIVLWTCRSGESLNEAVEYCRMKGLVFDAVNDNIADLGFKPLPKIYADKYIDDRNVFTTIDYDFWVALFWELKDKI